MAGPGAAAGAKAAGAAAGRVSGGAASRSGAAQAAKRGGAGAAAGKGSASGAGKAGGRGQSLAKLASFRPKRKNREDNSQEPFSSTASRLIGLFGGGMLFFILVIVAPLAVFDASAASCGGGEEEAVPIQTNHQSDPEDMSETQITIRIYLVGEVMNMTPRQIITAYATGYVESNMTNIYGGDATSSGVFQQQNFSPWTDGGRNRNNVIDSSIAFFLQLRALDTGQSIGDLAADVQKPAEEYEYRYALWVDEATDMYNKIRRLIGSAAGVKSIENLQGVTIGGGGLDSLSLGAACSSFAATGPANLKEVVTLYQPRSYKTLPASLTVGPPQQVDTRIWQDAVWVLRTYHLKAENARESGHSTHGDGTAMDMVPADGNSQKDWDSSARRLALDLGWTPGCAANGYSKAAGGMCNFVPAIILVAYNDFADGNHGDPAHGASFPHIHVSWYSSCYGCGGGALVEPREWVKAFPVGVEAETTTTVNKAPKKTKEVRS